MSESIVAMPSFKIVSAALRKTTEHLARELVQPSDAAPDWSELEWAIARAVSAMQGISALLAAVLPWSGPSLWESFLAEQRGQSSLRDARIGALLAGIDDATRRAKISCVGLKGAALRALGMYGPGERPMGDVDLLVRAGDLGALDKALRSLDYVHAFTSCRHTVYASRHAAGLHGYGEHPENPLKIELHTMVAESLPVSKVDITSRLQPGLDRPGLNAYPGLAALMLHLLLHAAANMRAHALRQIQLHDIAMLARYLGDADWRTLLAAPAGDRAQWWLFTPLALTERYYTDSVPHYVLEIARAACPPVLRLATDRQLLTDVSWSNLRIPAFPGIAWSRTPLEVLRLARSRIFPSRAALAGLKRARRMQPHLDEIPWYGISHASRIARWLFSRPPRVQTMVCVRASLENARTSPD